MLLNFLETNQIIFENKINSRFKHSKSLSIISSILERKNILNNTPSSLTEEESKKIELIKLILKTRKNLVLCLQRNLRKYLMKKKLKTYFIIKEIILKREKSALIIQKKFRNFLIKNHFNSLLQKDAIFLYNFPEDLFNKICILTTSKENFYKKLNKKNFELSIQIYKPNIRLNFEYSKYLKCYYVSLKKFKIIKKKLSINFIINNEKIIDPRYSIINDSKGNFYNVINSFMIFKKLKQRSPLIKSNFKEPKFWEELFILKNNKNYDNFSISSKTDISKEVEKNFGEYTSCIHRIKRKKIKSILKNNKNNKNIYVKKEMCKKVSFREEVELLD